MTIKRRAFIGAVSIGAVAATARGYDDHEGGYEGDEYGRRVRPNLTFGIGQGEAASMSVVWLPAPGREQAPPVKARIVLYELSGKVVAQKEAVIGAFSGAAVDYELPKGVKRQQVFGYAFVEGYEGELVDELFAGLEIYDSSSGKGNIAGGAVGLG
jgi:hypothetical protein